MDEKIEEMAMIALKNTISYTCAKQIAMNFYNAGYRKESDTAKEICDLILEYWKVDAFVDCSWVIEVISEKYGVDLGE